MPLIIMIKVVPSSGRNNWKKDKSGMLKCYLKNPPERNLANIELIKLLADALKVHKQDILIIQGQTTRTKCIKINRDITESELYVLLGIEHQKSLF